MSLRLEMLQIARLSPKMLGEGADLVRDFILSKINEDGGFADRGGRSDLYYTVFGLACLEALQAEFPKDRVRQWLASFGNGDTLDLAHLCSLIRCWAAAGGAPVDFANAMPSRLECWRSENGGYGLEKGTQTGNAYAGFLVLGAYGDLGKDLPDPSQLLASYGVLRTSDGGYANEPGMPIGNTPAVAAAESVIRTLGGRFPYESGEWLLKRHYQGGGFFAVPAAPMPDLLSTATALHALSGAGLDFQSVVEPCLDYIDSLWINRGGFYGNWGDEQLDCEYTFYGLLALGHLS